MKKSSVDSELNYISIIIPVISLDHEQKKNIEKLLDQGFRDIEYLFLVDDSVDIEKLDLSKKEFSSRIIRGKYDNFSSAVNEGISLSNGKYIGIFNSYCMPVSHMYYKLFTLTNDGEADIVLGNYKKYLFSEDAGVKEILNTEYDMLPADEEKIFTASAVPRIMSLTPCIPAAVFKKSLLTDNNIQALQDDDINTLFWYKALLASEKISYTKEALLNIKIIKDPDTSLEQKDFSVVFRQLERSLDAVGTQGSSEQIKALYEHILKEACLADRHPYIDKDNNMTSSLKHITERLDGDLVAALPDNDQKKIYYKYTSPLFSERAEAPKVLIYNWIPFDNPWGWGGGVTIYCKNIISELAKVRPDVQVYFISSGFAYLCDSLNTYVRKIDNIFGDNIHTYEIVNSPVPAEQRNLYVNPLIALENPSLKKIFDDFLREYGPFEAVHFNNIEGLSFDVLDLKKDHPDTQFIFSIHNYVPICVNGSYYMRHKHCNCNPDHTGEDCFKCTRADIKKDIADITYERGFFGIPKEQCVSRDRWIKHFGFDRLDIDVSPDDILTFARTATEKLNENCDSILAVSKRVYEIAAENGFDESKMSVSYIGTRVAARQLGHSCAKASDTLKIVFLGSDINFEEKGYAFLLDALSMLESSYASRIDLLLTVKQAEHAEIRSMLGKFRSVRIIQGYSHDDLKWIFSGAHLSIVPVLWEDNLPQIAIESVAYGVPVLTSSSGGAKELCSDRDFVFTCGDHGDLLEKIRFFVDNPDRISDYWLHHDRLVTMKEHIQELLGYYKVPDVVIPDSLSTVSGYNKLLTELNLLYSNFTNDKQHYVSKAEFDTLNKELERLRVSKESLQINAGEGAAMNNMNGKIIFQTDDNPMNEAIGAYMFKFTLDDFEFSDFYAEVHFVRINNIAPSVSDTLCISGTLLEKNGKRSITIHQADWQGFTTFNEWVYFTCDENEISFFAVHNGKHSGYSYNVDILTSRAEDASVEFTKIHNGFISENQMMLPDSFNSLEGFNALNAAE